MIIDHKTWLPLNTFQQMMLKWNLLIPYNAGHVMHMAGIPDITRWEKMALQTIVETKLGYPQFSHNDQYVHYQPIHTLSIEISTLDLNTHINNELNRPFLKTDFPIRFFIIQQETNYYFGAIYNHWIADSVAMRALLQRIFQRYQASDSSLPALSLDAPSPVTLFNPHLKKFSWLRAIKEVIQSVCYFQSAYRLKLHDPLNFQTGFKRYYLSPELVTRLCHYPKTARASINDFFLAALAKTLGQYTAAERKHKKRKKFRLFRRNRLAIGTIVDMRHHAKDKLDLIFGQYLSNYTVLLKEPENTPFTTLLNQITQQTYKMKSTGKSIKNFARWDLSLLSWKFLSKPKSQACFFNKNAPIIAGISNVNLTPSWIGKNSQNPSGFILDYIRISPAGLLLPLVFTLTTLHQQLSLCITFRTTCFTPKEIDQLSLAFMNHLSDMVNSRTI